MKDILRKIRNGAMEYIRGILEAVIKASLKEMLSMGMVKCIGLMAIYIEDGGRMEFSMVRENYLL